MGTDQGSASRAGRNGGCDGQGQPVIRGSGALSLSDRNPVAGLTRTVWRFSRDSYRFSRWAKRGVWERVFQHLGVEADNEYAMIDSTIVRAHQHSAGAVKKKTKTKPSDEAKGD